MKKFFSLFFLFFFCCLLEAQNLCLSSGFYVSRVSANHNDYLGKNTPFVKHTSSSFSFDFNIFYEFIVDESFSLKSGLYFPHKQICSFLYSTTENVPGTSRSAPVTYSRFYSYENFEVPLLLSIKSHDTLKIAKFNLDVGPYLGYCFHESGFDTYGYNFNHFDIGLDISVGIGGSKWKLCSYFLCSFKNRVTHVFDFDYLQYVRGSVFGFNLTRIINLKRKVVDKVL
jgi:hypothetical protein